MTTWTVPAVVTSVTDGDTLHVLADLGWHIAYTTKVRLIGLDCPEKDQPEPWAAARNFTATWLDGVDRTGGTTGLANVTIVSRALDKYGRILGDVYGQFLLPDKSTAKTRMFETRHLNAALLAAGHAVVMR